MVTGPWLTRCALVLTVAVLLWGAEPVELGSVGLILDLRSETSDAVLNHMQSEFEAIFHGAEVNLLWRILNADTPEETFDRIVMV